jgi:hypothetical protein
MLRLAPIGAGDRATYRATELREPQRREPSDDGLNKPQSPARMWFRRYRTQEVAGSSPASSTVEALHVRGFCLAIELNRGSVYRRSNVRALVSSVSFQASRLVRKSPGYRFWGNQEKPLRCHSWTTFTQHRIEKRATRHSSSTRGARLLSVSPCRALRPPGRGSARRTQLIGGPRCATLARMATSSSTRSPPQSSVRKVRRSDGFESDRYL